MAAFQSSPPPIPPHVPNASYHISKTMAARGRANMCSLHMCIVRPLLCESSSQPPSSSLDTIPTIIIIIIRRMCPAPYTDLSLLLLLCVVCDGARYTAGSARYINLSYFSAHSRQVTFSRQKESDFCILQKTASIFGIIVISLTHSGSRSLSS